MEITSVYETEAKPFEDTRTSYTPVEGSDHVTFGISGYDTFYGKLSFAQMCITPAQEIGCKILAAERVAE